jgi:RecA-family ATPase
MSSSYTTADYLALPRPDQVFIIDDLLPVGGSMLIYGDPKVGKSFIAMQLAQHVSRGDKWMGFETHQTSVLYVQLDTPRVLWMNRMDRLIESGEPFGNGGMEIHHADRESLDTWPFDILNPNHFKKLRDEVDRIQPGVVIIDTLKEAHQAPENDNTEGQRVIAALAAAVQPAALVIVHHARKLSDGRPNDIIQGARGAGYLTGRMDAVVSMSHRTMSYISRSTEGGQVKMERQENGYWEPLEEPLQLQQWIQNLLDQDGLSLRKKAETLAELSGKSVEACRSLLRRAKTEHSSTPHPPDSPVVESPTAHELDQNQGPVPTLAVLGA